VPLTESCASALLESVLPEVGLLLPESAHLPVFTLAIGKYGLLRQLFPGERPCSTKVLTFGGLGRQQHQSKLTKAHVW